MPTPGQRLDFYDDLPGRTLRQLFRPEPPADALANEVAALRGEIAALREELRPIPSLIVTGQRALDAFERLIEQGRGPIRP